MSNTAIGIDLGTTFSAVAHVNQHGVPEILSNAQVAVILKMSAQGALQRDEDLHDVYKKTQKYVERFNTMKNAEKDQQELVGELDNLQG